MTKISNDTVYTLDEVISDLDSFVGTNGDSLSKPTKTFLLGQLRTYILGGLNPSTGGTLRISEFVYSGVLTTPQAVVNAIDPPILIRPYEIFVVNVNNNKYLLTLQNTEIGLDKTPAVSSNFINIQGNTGPQGIQGVQGVQGVQGIQGNVGEQGIQGPIGNTGSAGSAGATGADASNNLQRDETTSNFTLADTDNNYVIQVKNGATPITITIPNTGLRTKFNVGFKLKGTGDVTVVGGVGVTVINPIGFKGKGQGYSIYIERDGATQNYDLLGDTKI